MSQPPSPKNLNTFRFLRNVFLKTLLLFGLCNLFYALYQPADLFARLSLYNVIFPGRTRFPFGERPDLSYNLTINQLPAMFASHEINGAPKPEGEYRILLFGDSSVWGYLLSPQETLSGQINLANLTLRDGRVIRAYNLGYPTISLTKDLWIMQQAARFRPDMLIWLVTLEAFPRSRQLDSPLLQNNPQPVQALIQRLGLDLETPPAWDAPPALWQKTIVGQRRELADLFRLQVYGVLWSATGVDYYIPPNYEPPAQDLENTVDYYGMRPPRLDQEVLAFDLLDAAEKLAEGIPLLIVNEPIFRASGKNSDVRYNLFYPRWVYDQYREHMLQLSQHSNWLYLDAWDTIPPAYFTNSAIHMNAAGSQQLARAILQKVVEYEAKP